MRHFLATLFACVTIVSSVSAQDAPSSFIAIHGHFIGESVAAFLSAEPEAQQEADVCRQHAGRPSCARLLAALDRRQRVEISTSDSIDFTLDGGKLVKLTMLVDDSFDAASKFGTQARVKTIAGQNALGQKWEDRLMTWELPDVSATVYEDHNPAQQDRRRLLVVEARANMAQAYTVSVQKLTEREVGSNIEPAR